MSLDLRRILTGIVGLFGLLVFAFSGLGVYEAFTHHQAIARFTQANAASEALLKLAADLAIERGLSNAPLHAPNPLSADRRDEIAKVGAYRSHNAAHPADTSGE